MMRTNSDTVSNDWAVKRFTAYLEDLGLRKTPERMAVLECALEFERHFTLEDLQRRLELRSLRLSRTTVYSALDLLMASGLLRRVVLDGHATLYERASGPELCHLVCTGCGKVKAVRDVELMASLNARKYNAFTAQRSTVTVYGTCSACARKGRRG